MKQVFLAILLVMFLPLNMFSQSYESLWNEADKAARKDLPKTQMDVLDKIVAMAKAKNDYGQLLAAELKRANLQCQITPDSLQPAVARLEAAAAEADTSCPVLAAVYHAVLGNIYSHNTSLGHDHAEKGLAHYRQALADPALLAQTSAATCQPLVGEGSASRYFGDDLLHVIGNFVDNWVLLRDHYVATGNRPAACLSSLYALQEEGKNDVAHLDSLINDYGDLPVCSQVAIARYQFMGEDDEYIDEDITDRNRLGGEKYRFAQNAVSRWGDGPGINLLRNELNALTAAQLSTELLRMRVGQGTAAKLALTTRHINKVVLTVTRLSVDGDHNLNPNEKSDLEKLKQSRQKGTELPVVRTYETHPDYEYLVDTVSLPALSPGVYLIETKAADADVKPLYDVLHVSNVFPLYEQQPDTTLRVAVVDCQTGQPLPHAKVRLRNTYTTGKDTTPQILSANEQGEMRFSKKQWRKRNELFAYTDADKASLPDHLWRDFSYRCDTTTQVVEVLFTDRSVYRPGQVVHAAAVCYRQQWPNTVSVMGNHTVTFTLRDVNGEEVGHKEAVTDGFGSAAVDFQLSPTGLTGRYSLSSDVGYCNFSVEEYKRPTFQVELDKVTRSYQAGDTLIITGQAKSYAGVPVQKGKVSYKVTREHAFWWWRSQPDDAATLLTDTTITDDNGRFEVRMPLVMPASSHKDQVAFFDFEVEAQVTDQGGESHTASLSLPLGNRSTVLMSDLPDKMRRESLPELTFSYRNAAGNNVESVVNYTIDGGRQQQADAGKPVRLPQTLASGAHRLEATCGTDTLKQDFVVFSMDDRRPPVSTDDWFYQSAEMFPNNGDPVYIQVGASDADQYILYSVFAGNMLIKEGVIRQSNALTTWKLTYKEKYGDGLRINFVWVKDEKVHSHSATIRRPEPDRRLRLSWTTFRNRLEPGNDEQWTLSVLRPDGRPAEAQLMAVLYDKSLEAILPHSWNLQPRLPRFIPYVYWGFRNLEEATYQKTSFAKYPQIDIEPFSLRMINPSYFSSLFFSGNRNHYSIRGRMGGPRMMMAMAKSADSLDMIESEATLGAAKFERSLSLNEEMVVSDNGATRKKTADQQPASNSIQLRQNLAETAFFRPCLLTNPATGSVDIRFKLPESVTTWRFMGLAHDKTMNTGLLTDEVVAQKTVMVQPNVPRFVRQGDNATLTARIANTSEKAVSGCSRLELLTPSNERVVYTEEHPFNLSQGAIAAVTFRLPSEVLTAQDGDLLVVRVTAQGDGFSDGEQHYLPLLSNCEYVTDTHPFTQHQPGTFSLAVDKLFPAGSTRQRLTVTYTDNPAWLMVQALPYVGRPNNRDAISLAAAFYANTLSRTLLKACPQVRGVFEQWRREPAGGSSLSSPLDRDADLKSLLLSETPWVSDALSETEQRQSLARYFDDNTLDSELEQTLTHLAQLQHADGSFGWWPGMSGSPCLTTAVVKMMARLKMLTGTLDSRVQPMIDRAFAFLDLEAAKEVAEMKRLEKRGTKNIVPSDQLCDYTYASSLYGRAVTANQRYVVDRLASAPVRLTIYGKAASAVLLARYGRIAKAKEYLQSLKEYAVSTPEMGLYFDTPRAYYSWRNYRIPTQVAAIEAMKTIDATDTSTIEQMQRWLLQEKRTQAWDTPLVSADAIWAFLSPEEPGHAFRQLAPKTATRLCLDQKELETGAATAGLGYVKATLTAPDAKTFTAEKTSEGTSWGALYAQYFQPTAAITDASAGLTVTREVVTGGKPLHVGDRVKVRITLRADRDYDFVQVVDRRASCLEPVRQTSGYGWGFYEAPKDATTTYYFDKLSKGTHEVETEYYVDREGNYQSGTCTAQCAYAPEYSGRTKAVSLTVGRK